MIRYDVSVSATYQVEAESAEEAQGKVQASLELGMGHGDFLYHTRPAMGSEDMHPTEGDAL